MRKIYIVVLALLLAVVFTSTGYADKAVKKAEAEFKEVRKAYVAAKEELSDAQVDSFLTVGKTEKQEAVKRIWNARKELRKAKKAYKKALSELHKAETARDAKIDRTPWK